MPGALTAAGLGAGMIAAGLGFGTPALLVPGVGLVFLGVVSFVWVELATPRHLIRAQGPTRIVEGESFELRIEASGARVPPPTAELTDPVLRQPITLGPRWTGRVATTVWIRGRGRRRLEPSRLEVRDPLGLRSRVVSSDDPGELLVLPRIEPVMAANATGGGIRAGTTTGIEEGSAARQLDARAIELEVDGLRAYREGTPASRIHWPAVARTGQLVERQLISGAESAPIVALDASRPASPAALDAAVRAAGSLCVHLAGHGGCAVLLSGQQRATEIEADMRGWPALHSRLAILGPSNAQPVLSRVLRSGTVFWVTAHARPVIPAALSGSGGAARFLVAPVEGNSPTAVFTVAGCAGWRIGARSRASGMAA